MAGNKNSGNDGPSDWELPEESGSMDDVQTRGDAEAGRYLVKIHSMDLKGRKDDPDEKFFNLGFRVVDVDNAEKEAVIGSSAWDIFNLNKESLWKLKSLIKACGFDGTGSRIPNLNDCELICDFYVDTYNKDNPQIRTRRYKPAEGWSGIHETRDASEPLKDAKDKSSSAKDQKQLPPGKKADAGKGEIEI